MSFHRPELDKRPWALARNASLLSDSTFALLVLNETQRPMTTGASGSNSCAITALRILGVTESESVTRTNLVGMGESDGAVEGVGERDQEETEEVDIGVRKNFRHASGCGKKSTINKIVRFFILRTMSS